MKGTRIVYSADELAWIEARRADDRRATHAAFVARFGRRDLSLQNLNALCKRKGWLTGRTGRYEAGSTPANKGKSMPYNANSARTQFKKGGRSGVARLVYKPIGTERLSKDGYLERKVHDGLPMQSRWRAVHLLNWEAAHGTVPQGMCLKCLDGNKLNTDASNWAAVPRAMIPLLAGRYGMDYDAAEPELKPSIMALAKLKHAMKVATDRAGKP